MVTEIANRLKENGHVYEGTYEGWYCPRCADFKTDAELIEGNKCPIHLIELEREKEDNWFFRFSAFQERLEKHFADNPEWVLPKNRYNEALSFIKGGLQDLSLSRARISWGVPVPWDPDQVIYVWIDALLNYYSALSYARPGEDLTEKFWPATLHLIAKDILKFHAVIWPALLMAADLPLPKRVFIHGYLLMDEHKMSKSLGNVLDPFAVMDLYGTDALRYYLLREVAFGGDGSISPEGFETRYNTELANEYGNLASRSLAMIGKYRDGVVPEAQAPAEPGGRVRRADRRGEGVPRPRRREHRARAHLAAGARAQPLRDRDGAVEALEGRVEGGGARLGALRARGGAARGVGAAAPLDPRVGREAAHRARARGPLARHGAGSATLGGGATIGELGQLFPKVEPPEADAA